MPEDLCFLQYVPEYVEAEQDCDAPAFEGSYMPAPGEFAPEKFASQSLVTGHAAAETHAGQYKVATDMPTCILCCSFKFTSSCLKTAARGAQHLYHSHDDAHSHAQSLHTYRDTWEILGSFCSEGSPVLAGDC